jgi:hypothetical protein
MGVCGAAGGKIGDGCSTAADCSGVDTTLVDMFMNPGGPAACQKAQLQLLPDAGAAQGATYQGGYCTRQCNDDLQCGDGNICGFYGGSWGEALNICYHGCDVDSDCKRPGYLCLTVNSGGSPSGICTPSNQPDGGLSFYDPGPGPARGTVGKPCTTDVDCQTETGYGKCISGTIADGGSSGYAGGYCTVDCTMAAEIDSWCMGQGTSGTADGGAWCIPYFFSDQNMTPYTEWFCLPGCQPGNNDCRTGYECIADPFWNDTAGTIKDCEPDCTATSDCSASGGCLTSLGCYNAMCDATTKACKFQ